MVVCIRRQDSCPRTWCRSSRRGVQVRGCLPARCHDRPAGLGAQHTSLAGRIHLRSAHTPQVAHGTLDMPCPALPQLRARGRLQHHDKPASTQRPRRPLDQPWSPIGQAGGTHLELGGKHV